MKDQLSKNFNLNEIAVSKRYPELAKNVDIKLEHILSAQILSLICLQPGRDRFGIFDIVSWLRDEELNKAVGGSPSSDHLFGCAADVVPRNFHAEQVFKWYVQESNIPFRQIIYYPDSNFFHISCNHPLKPFIKREAFVFNGKKYISFQEHYK